MKYHLPELTILKCQNWALITQLNVSDKQILAFVRLKYIKGGLKSVLTYCMVSLDSVPPLFSLYSL